MTAFSSIFQIFAAREQSCLMTASADCVTNGADAKVTRLPPVRLEKPTLAVSPIRTLTRLGWMPSSSAATMAVEAREPPTSGWTAITVTALSSVTLTCALDLATRIEPVAGGDTAPLVLAEGRLAVLAGEGLTQRLLVADHRIDRSVPPLVPCLAAFFRRKLDRIHPELPGQLIEHALDREGADRRRPARGRPRPWSG